MAGQNSGEKLAGIEGQVGEEQEEGEGYLSMVLVGTRSGGRVVAGGAAARGRWWRRAGDGPVREGRRRWSGSTGVMWETDSEAQTKRREAGGRAQRGSSVEVGNGRGGVRSGQGKAPLWLSREEGAELAFIGQGRGGGQAGRVGGAGGGPGDTEARRRHPRVAWRTGKAAWARGASSRCQGCVVSAEPGVPRRFGSGARRVGGQVGTAPQ